MTEEQEKKLAASAFDFHIWGILGLSQMRGEDVRRICNRRKMQRHFFGYDEKMIAEERNQKLRDMDEECRMATSDYQSLNPPQKPSSVPIYI